MSDDGFLVALDGHDLGRRQGGNESYVSGLLEGFEGLPGLPAMRIYLDQDAAPTLQNRFTGASGVAPASMRSGGSLARLAWRLPRRLRRDGPAVAHFQYTPAPRCPCPYVLSIHDASFVQAPETLGRLLAARLRLTIPWAVDRAEVVLVPSWHTARALDAAYPGVRGRIRVVPLAASGCFTHRRRGSDDAVRAALGLPATYLLYVGRRQRRKNVVGLVRHYAEARRRDASLPPLCLVGPASAQDRKIQRAAVRHAIPDLVRLVDHVPARQLPAVYRGASLFLFPCRHEGFGLAPLEAMASGCPVLASDDGAVAEWAEGAARLLSPLDVEAWANAICGLARDREGRQELAAAGVARSACFSWTATARATVDAYRWVARRTQARP